MTDLISQRSILAAVAEGRLSVDDALSRLDSPQKSAHFDAVTENGRVVARLDTQRRHRQGFPEVILAQGKKFDHLSSAIEQSLSHGDDLLITRVKEKRGRKLALRFPELTHNVLAKCLYRQMDPDKEGEGNVVVFSAGTSDIGVAEEAVLTARLMGAKVTPYYDAGVAGLHRLLAAESLFNDGRVFIVVAGMEGALPSVVGGLVRRPVIAVPTSIGYGASLGGMAALMGMLNSCSSNVTVVNIDNGFGAGYVAGLINRWGDSTAQEE